jgi:hypothetical protein
MDTLYLVLWLAAYAGLSYGWMYLVGREWR